MWILTNEVLRLISVGIKSKLTNRIQILTSNQQSDTDLKEWTLIQHEKTYKSSKCKSTKNSKTTNKIHARSTRKNSSTSIIINYNISLNEEFKGKE